MSVMGVNLVKIGRFGEKGQKWVILGTKWRHSPKFRESDQIFFSQNVSKNYFSQVYRHKFGQKCHKWSKFGQDRSFLVKMVKIRSFWIMILGTKMSL